MGQAKQRGSYEERRAASEARHAAYIRIQLHAQRERERYAQIVRRQTPARVSRAGSCLAPLVSLTFTTGTFIPDHSA